MSRSVPSGEDGIIRDTVCTEICPDVERCPIRTTVKVLDGKYKPIILWYLGNGVMRFGELGRVVPEATSSMLSKQLRELEADGLVSRAVYPEVPPRTEYSLTEKGRSILPVISAMYDWGIDHIGGCPDDRRSVQIR